MAKYKIEIDEDACISCGACVGACDNFELKDKAKVKKVLVQLGFSEDSISD